MNKNTLTEKVHMMHENGYSIRDIAIEMGMSKSKIGRIIRDKQASAPRTTTGTRPNNLEGTDGVAIGTRPNVIEGTPGTGFGTVQNPVPDTERDADGTQIRNKYDENDVVLRENEELAEIEQRFDAHISFFNGEIDSFLGDLLVLTRRRYMVPFALLERYQQRAQRLLEQGAQICWEMGFDCNEYKEWGTLAIVSFYLDDYITKGYSFFKADEPVDFRLESLYIRDMKVIYNDEFFSIR